MFMRALLLADCEVFKGKDCLNYLCISGSIVHNAKKEMLVEMNNE